MSCLWFGDSGEFTLNVPNQGQIDNLPRNAVVECIALVERDSYKPLAAGKLPLVLENLIHPHVICQEMLVEAAVEKNREKAIMSLVLDPIITDLERGRNMAEELLSANEGWL